MGVPLFSISPWKLNGCCPHRRAFATAFAKSLVLSVFPVPAGPAGAQPMHKCKAWRGEGWTTELFFGLKKGGLGLQMCGLNGVE